MKINTRLSAVSTRSGHQRRVAASYGFRCLTPGGMMAPMSGIDEEDAGGGSGAAESGAFSSTRAAPPHEPTLHVNSSVGHEGATALNTTCYSSVYRAGSPHCCFQCHHQSVTESRHYQSTTASSIDHCQCHQPTGSFGSCQSVGSFGPCSCSSEEQLQSAPSSRTNRSTSELSAFNNSHIPIYCLQCSQCRQSVTGSRLDHHQHLQSAGSFGSCPSSSAQPYNTTTAGALPTRSSHSLGSPDAIGGQQLKGQGQQLQSGQGLDKCGQNRQRKLQSADALSSVINSTCVSDVNNSRYTTHTHKPLSPVVPDSGDAQYLVSQHSLQVNTGVSCRSDGCTYNGKTSRTPPRAVNHNTGPIAACTAWGDDVQHSGIGASSVPSQSRSGQVDHSLYSCSCLNSQVTGNSNRSELLYEAEHDSIALAVAERKTHRKVACEAGTVIVSSDHDSATSAERNTHSLEERLISTPDTQRCGVGAANRGLTTTDKCQRQTWAEARLRQENTEENIPDTQTRLDKEEVILEDVRLEDVCTGTDGTDDVFAPNDPVSGLLTSGRSSGPFSRVVSEGEEKIAVDCSNQEPKVNDITGLSDKLGSCRCVTQHYESLISRKHYPEDGRRYSGATISSGGEEINDMFRSYRSSSVPDHKFRQGDLGIIKSAVNSELSAIGGETQEMPSGGGLTTIVGAATSATPTPPTFLNGPKGEHADLAVGTSRPCSRPSTSDGLGLSSNSNLRLAALCSTSPMPPITPEVGITIPEFDETSAGLPVKMPSAFSPQTGRYTPRRRELIRLSPLPVSPCFTERSRSNAAVSLSSSPTADHGFRPISPTRGSRSNPSLYTDSLPLPGYRCSRTPSPTLSVRSLSPVPHTRERSNTYSGPGAIRGDLHSFLSPPRSPARMPRDAQQPARGSISDLTDKHSPGEDAGEEADTFHFRPFQRQRSSTCPENRAFRRRKIASTNRPPTPPPLGASGSRNSSPRGSLGDASAARTVAGAVITLTPTLSRRSDLSDLREDTLDYGDEDDLPDFDTKIDHPVTIENTTGNTKKSVQQSGGIGIIHPLGDHHQTSVAIIERLCIQSNGTEKNSGFNLEIPPPGSLPALRH